MTSAIPVSSALLRTISGPAVYDVDLARAFETGEAHTRRASNGPAKPVARLSSRFITRGKRPPKQPDSEQEREVARQRRRMWGGMNKMPPELRGHYTEGERAALNKIAEQVGKHRRCDMRISAIAKAVGIKRTTFQNAIRKALRHGHVTVEHRPRAGLKNDTNIVRVVSVRWLAWLAAGIGFKELNTSEIQESKPPLSASAEPLHGAYEREKAAKPTSDSQALVTNVECSGVHGSSFLSGMLKTAGQALNHIRNGGWARPDRQARGWSRTFGS